MADRGLPYCEAERACTERDRAHLRTPTDVIDGCQHRPVGDLGKHSSITAQARPRCSAQAAQLGHRSTSELDDDAADLT